MAVHLDGVGFGVRIWRGGDEGVDVGVAGAWDIRLIVTMMEILFSFIVTVCNRTLIMRKSSSVRPINSSQVPVALDAVSLSLVAVSGALTTNTVSCGLNVKVSHRRQS